MGLREGDSPGNPGLALSAQRIQRGLSARRIDLQCATLLQIRREFFLYGHEQPVVKGHFSSHGHFGHIHTPLHCIYNTSTPLSSRQCGAPTAHRHQHNIDGTVELLKTELSPLSISHLRRFRSRHIPSPAIGDTGVVWRCYGGHGC